MCVLCLSVPGFCLCPPVPLWSRWVIQIWQSLWNTRPLVGQFGTKCQKLVVKPVQNNKVQQSMAAVSHWREPRLPCPVAIKCVAALLRCALYLNTHTHSLFCSAIQCSQVRVGLLWPHVKKKKKVLSSKPKISFKRARNLVCKVNSTIVLCHYRENNIYFQSVKQKVMKWIYR